MVACTFCGECKDSIPAKQYSMRSQAIKHYRSIRTAMAQVWHRIGSKTHCTHWTEFRTIFCPFRCGGAKSTNLSAFGMCPKLRPFLTYTAEIHFLEFDNLSQPRIFVCFSGLDPINLRNQSSYHVNISPSKSITDNPKDELRPLKEESRFQSYR